MSNKNELRKTMLSRAKQKRIQRVQSNANKYRGGKLNSSDKAYISGDYNKTASNRAWYYNTHDGYQGYTNFTGGRQKSRYQKLLKGENPYKIKYIKTNKTHYVPPGKRKDGSTYNGFYTKNRLLKNGEYSNFLKYGTFNKNVVKQKNAQAKKVNKYAILSSHKTNPKNFLDQLNTGTLDGIRTARNKGGGFEYIKGGLKDFIADPAIDFLKSVDAIESAGLNGLFGLADTGMQIADAITSPGVTLKKDVNWKQAYENAKHSLETSNKTGWGDSSGVSLRKINEGSINRASKMLRTSKGSKSANKYLQDELKSEGYQNTALMIAGFVADIANPINLGGKVIDTVRNGKKAFRSVPEGFVRNTDDIPEFIIDDIATSVRPGQEAQNARMKWVYEQADKYRKKDIPKNVDEVTGEILPTTKVNNYYDGVLNSVEDVVERTPKKHKEDVLDILTESKPMRDMKLFDEQAGSYDSLDSILERGYRNAIDNDVERVVKPTKNIPHKIKDIEIETMLDEIDSKSYLKYDDKLDEYLDTLSDNDFDYVMDYLQKNHPDIYSSYMKLSDNADTIADDAITLERMKDKQSEKLAREMSKEKIKPVSNEWDMKEKEYFATKNTLDVLDKITSGGKISNVTPTLSTRKKILSDTLNKYIGDLKDGTLNVRAISYITNRLKNARIPTETKIEFINNRLFNGQKLIPNNMSERNINEFLGQLQEIHKIVDDYTQYNRINAKGNLDFSQLPESIQKFLRNFELENAKGDISDYSSYVDKLTGDITKNINKNSRGLVDLRYNDKASYLAHKFGYQNFKNEIKIPLDKIEKRLEVLDKQPYTPSVAREKDELIARKRQLLEVSKARGAEADVIRNMNPTEFDNYYPKHLPEGVDIKLRPTKKFKQKNTINLVDDFDDAVKESVENVSKYNRENAFKTNKNVDFKILRDEVRKTVKKEHPEYENFFGTKEYNNYINKRTQLEQWHNTKSEIAYESKDKILNRDTFRNNNSSNKKIVERTNTKLNDGSIGYKNVYEDGSVTISSKDGTYEVPEYISKLQDEISTYDNIYDNFVQCNKLAEYFNIPKPAYNANNVKYNKNIKPIQIPEVQQNMFSLGELIDKEADLYLHYRLKYDDIQENILNLKREYLKAIMSYGVKDVSNIKARANERLMDIIKSEKNPVIKMDLQLLANKNKHVIEQVYESALSGGNISKPLDNIIDEFEDPWETLQNVNKPIDDADDWVYWDDNPVSDVVQNVNKPIDDVVNNEYSLADKLKETIDKLGEYFYTNFREPSHGKFKLRQSDNGLYHHYVDIENGEILDLNDPDVLKQLDIDMKDPDYDPFKSYFEQNPIALEHYQQNNGISNSVEDVSEHVIDDKTKNLLQHNNDWFNSEHSHSYPDVESLPHYDKPPQQDYFVNSEGYIVDGNTGEIIDKYQPPTIENGYETNFPQPDVSEPKPSNNKPNTPLDNVDKPNTPHTPLDNVDKPNDKPNTPLDNVNKPNDKPNTPLDNVNKPNDKPNTPLDNVNPNPKPNNKPKPNNNKPKPEPKPEPTPNTPHQNNNNKPNNSKPRPDILKFFTEKTGSNVNKKMGYEKTKLYDLYKRWLNTWKKGVTVYNPGWHVQNYLQNKGQNYLALGMDAFGNQKKARQMLDYLRGESPVPPNIIDKYGNELNGFDLADFASEKGVAESAQATNILAEPRTIIPSLDKFLDESKLMRKLSRSEETARLHHYITQIERGMSPEDAVKSVNKYLFDYDNKSKFDRVIQDFIDPFWIFHKNQARLLTTSVLENPSRTANINRARRGLEQSVPDEDKNSNFSVENGKYQAPSGSFTDSKNKDRYDYMFQENIMPYFMNAIPKDGQDLQNKMNPLLKLAIQQKNNEGDFGAKVVEGDKAGYNELTKDERKWEIARDINPFVNNLVTTAYNANKVYERKQSKETSDLQALELWLKYITGVKGKHEHNISWSNKYTKK